LQAIVFTSLSLCLYVCLSAYLSVQSLRSESREAVLLLGFSLLTADPPRVIVERSPVSAAIVYTVFPRIEADLKYKPGLEYRPGV